MPFDEIEDPQGICKNITNIGRWGNGDGEVTVATVADIEQVMPLVQQSFMRHRDDEDE
jgi:predicted transport protein